MQAWLLKLCYIFTFSVYKMSDFADVVPTRTEYNGSDLVNRPWYSAWSRILKRSVFVVQVGCIINTFTNFSSSYTSILVKDENFYRLISQQPNHFVFWTEPLPDRSWKHKAQKVEMLADRVKEFDDISSSKTSKTYITYSEIDIFRKVKETLVCLSRFTLHHDAHRVLIPTSIHASAV